MRKVISLKFYWVLEFRFRTA